MNKLNTDWLYHATKYFTGNINIFAPPYSIHEIWVGQNRISFEPDPHIISNAPMPSGPKVTIVLIGILLLTDHVRTIFMYDSPICKGDLAGEVLYLPDLTPLDEKSLK